MRRNRNKLGRSASLPTAPNVSILTNPHTNQLCKYHVRQKNSQRKYICFTSSSRGTGEILQPRLTSLSISILQNTVDPLELQKLQEQKRRQRAKRKAENRRTVRTPEPVAGRKHIDVQTDLYLEELNDKVPEAIAMTQTDAFINRAPSPLYIPRKSGLDVATQIYDGELFDFNMEVAPILDVIVGKTLEQALMEVNEENELAIIRAHHVCDLG